MKISIPLSLLCVWTLSSSTTMTITTTMALVTPLHSSTSHVQRSLRLYSSYNDQYNKFVQQNTNVYPNEGQRQQQVRQDFPRPADQAGPLGVYQERPTRSQQQQHQQQQRYRQQQQYHQQQQQHQQYRQQQHYQQQQQYQQQYQQREVQGGSRRIHQNHPYSRSQEVFMETDGRPLEGNIELWEGPGNTPQAMRVWSEDGLRRPFRATVETPMGRSSQVDIKNAGSVEFPIRAGVVSNEQLQQSYRTRNTSMNPNFFFPQPYQQSQQYQPLSNMGSNKNGQTIQGDGGIQYFPVDGSISSVQILMWNEGLPFMAKIEILQGPNSVRQVADIYVDDGRNRPISTILETPGYGSTIQIRNVGPMCYPLKASVVPYQRNNQQQQQYRRPPAALMGDSRGSGSGGSRSSLSPYYYENNNNYNHNRRRNYNNNRQRMGSTSLLPDGYGGIQQSSSSSSYYNNNNNNNNNYNYNYNNNNNSNSNNNRLNINSYGGGYGTYGRRSEGGGRYDNGEFFFS